MPDDIDDMYPRDAFPDFGYDPTLDAGIVPPPPLAEADVPSRAQVTMRYLPPVGQQGTLQHPGAPGTCTAWASTYGLATFTAAKRTKTPPTSNSLIASPAYIYLQVKEQAGQKPPPCKGSSFLPYFDILASQGTPNLANAPYFTQCQELTSWYQGKTIAPDTRFVLEEVSHVSTSDMLRLKQLLASNCPIAYATHLYTDWGQYKGDPPVYVGNGIKIIGPNGKPAGHCMLIIGYDQQKQAFYIQNSESTAWGLDGYVWMAYQTFQNLAEAAAAFYYAN